MMSHIIVPGHLQHYYAATLYKRVQVLSVFISSSFLLGREMLLQILLAVVCAPLVLGSHFNFGQRNLVGPVRPYSAITRQDLVLRQDPALRDLAAKRKERIHVRLNASQSTVIAEEAANVNFDCLPLLSQFPGATAEWTFQQHDINGRGKS